MGREPRRGSIGEVRFGDMKDEDKAALVLAVFLAVASLHFVPFTENCA
jgi:hypothetical protein